MDYGRISDLFSMAAKELDDNQQKTIDLIEKGVEILTTIPDPSLKEFASNCIYEQTGKEDPAFFPFLITYLLQHNFKHEARHSLKNVAHRLVEPCAIEPFEIILANKPEELENCIENRVVHKCRVSKEHVENAWKEYRNAV